MIKFRAAGLRTKTSLVLLSVLVACGALISSGASWIQVKQESVSGLGPQLVFTGYESFGYILPLVLVFLAGILLAASSSGSLQKVARLISFSASLLLFALWIFDVSNQNISGLVPSLERSTGVGGAAMSQELKISILGPATFSGVLFLLMTLSALVFIILGGIDGQRPKRRKVVAHRGEVLDDSISIWDNQVNR